MLFNRNVAHPLEAVTICDCGIQVAPKHVAFSGKYVTFMRNPIKFRGKPITLGC